MHFTHNVLAVYFGEQSNIAYISHIIGFLIGIPFGAAWSKNFAKNLLITAGLFLIYLTIVIFLVPLLVQASA
jgi:hypothetical protein